ncbi:gephyrin-like molybdotransferase Glp [Sporomusa aerivorans]|uniref:molybdopterin molybdotransferase MoeA n=1 Tax=Sporomusa aerivorans TaxID=204936 RepID=UPI00352A6C61
MDFFNCISLRTAQGLVADALSVSPTGVEEVDLIQALGRVVAEDISAGSDLPPFSRSTVDGYAVLSRDTFGAGEGVPVMLAVVGEVLMGQSAEYSVVPGQAVVIPTGGMLPAGADAVVMLEYTECSDNETLLVLKPVAPGENVVVKGEDIKAGTVFITAGSKLTAAEIGALAACGIAKVKVFGRLTVGVISTGDEVVAVDVVPVGGQVRDINSYTLGAMLAETDCQVRYYGIIKDNYEKLRQAIIKAVTETKLVLVSGGSSVGARDHTVRVIEELGQQRVMFHGLAVKPGKPTIFGMIGQVPVFGLPGHPVAAMTVCQSLVIPAVKKMHGLRTGKAGIQVLAKLTRNIASAPGRDDFLRVRLVWREGEYLAEPVLGKSGLISVMTQADGIVRISAESSGLYAGDVVNVEVMREA